MKVNDKAAYFEKWLQISFFRKLAWLFTLAICKGKGELLQQMKGRHGQSSVKQWLRDQAVVFLKAGNHAIIINQEECPILAESCFGRVNVRKP